MTTHLPQLGAPDPELNTSPIFDEGDDVSADLELEAGVCYFNNVAYRIGQYVMSGNEVLRCEGRGVWMREGETQPWPSQDRLTMSIACVAQIRHRRVARRKWHISQSM